MIYLASLIFIILQQNDIERDLFEIFFINIVLTVIAVVLWLIFSWPFLNILIIVLGLGWGFICLGIREAGLNLLILFFILTLIFGFINAFIINTATILFIILAFYSKVIFKSADFQKFIFWLGLSSRYKYYMAKENNIVEVKDNVKYFDLSMPPKEIEGYKVVKHNTGPKNLHFSPAEYCFYYVNAQKSGRTRGADILKDVMIKEAYNANLLDGLLENQELIPPNFKDLKICFWGTQYERNGIRYVRVLVHKSVNFKSVFMAIDRIFDGQTPALDPVTDVD